MKINNTKNVMLNSFQHPHLTQTLDKKDEILNQVQDDNIDRTVHGFTPLVTPQGLCAGYRGGPHTISRTTTLRDDVVCGPRGFTLIELLVVVLIIGILAAVAVPQYQRAVEKSKATQALSLLKSLAQATQSYYLANGKYPTQFEQLDVDMTAWTGKTIVHKGGVQDTKSNEDWSLQLWTNNPGNNIMIMALRTAGKYKGAGFYFNVAFSLNCVEDSVDSDNFPRSKAGMYCEKLFNGTVIDPPNTFRQYRLP